MKFCLTVAFGETFMHRIEYSFGFLLVLEKILESFLLMARPRSCYRTHTTFHHTPHCFGAPQIFHTLPGRSRAASLFFFLLSLAVCGGGWGWGIYSLNGIYGNSCPASCVGCNRCNYWDRSFSASFASPSVATFRVNVLLVCCVSG